VERFGPPVAAILTDAFRGVPGYLCAMNARAFSHRAIPVSCSFSRGVRCSVALVALLATPLGGCSFDLGSWGTDSQKPQPVAQKPADNSSNARSSTDSQSSAARGQMLARSGKNEEALAEFDRALALDPYNVQALYGRGLIYQGEKQYKQAIEDFTAANGLTPQKVEPLLGRATSYLAIDKAREAAADLDEAVQADPNSAPAWSARGQAYERLGDKAKAAASYGRAIAIRPKDDAARSGLARTGG
jgi:tetratricopeptide (TPR) repeat protein